MGTLLGHITGTARHRDLKEGKTMNFQPMNANFGLFPILQPPVKKKLRKAAYAERALADLTTWLAD
jgi:methylenetetrahydrofolate--tRNA-(uracil-5-)-methyltransferase